MLALAYFVISIISFAFAGYCLWKAYSISKQKKAEKENDKFNDYK